MLESGARCAASGVPSKHNLAYTGWAPLRMRCPLARDICPFRAVTKLPVTRGRGGEWETTQSYTIDACALRLDCLCGGSMPELPEVEIVCRNLAAWVQGRTITGVRSTGQHRGVATESFPTILGCQVVEVSRLGK